MAVTRPARFSTWIDNTTGELVTICDINEEHNIGHVAAANGWCERLPISLNGWTREYTPTDRVDDQVIWVDDVWISKLDDSRVTILAVGFEGGHGIRYRTSSGQTVEMAGDTFRAAHRPL